MATGQTENCTWDHTRAHLSSLTFCLSDVRSRDFLLFCKVLKIPAAHIPVMAVFDSMCILPQWVLPETCLSLLQHLSHASGSGDIIISKQAFNTPPVKGQWESLMRVGKRLQEQATIYYDCHKHKKCGPTPFYLLSQFLLTLTARWQAPSALGF